MGLSRTVSEIYGHFSRKSQNFSTPIFCVPAEGVPLGIGYQHWGQKLEWWGYWADKEV